MVILLKIIGMFCAVAAVIFALRSTDDNTFWVFILMFVHWFLYSMAEALF